MKNLAAPEEAKLLDQLRSMIDSHVLRPSDAWSCISKPETKKQFTTTSIVYKKGEVVHLKSLKSKLIEHLEKKTGKRCSYCKRAMGKHGYSWHIEHIRCKLIHPNLAFSLNNLTLACIDCNFAKNHSVDSVKPYSFDIINPNEASFIYGKHISYLQISTEIIHILKYTPRSSEGKNTHKKLKFKALEYSETIRSLNNQINEICDMIERQIPKMQEKDETHEIADFLQKIKMQILSPE